MDALKIVHLIPSIFALIIIGLIILVSLNTVYLNILIIIISVHLIISIVTSIKYLNEGKFRYLFFIPFLIFLMHFIWGTGFFIGLLLPKSKKW